jgi:dehydratase
MKSTLFKAGTAVVAALAAAVVVAPTAAAATDIVYDCEATTPLGPEYATLDQSLDATAPATVAPGAAFDVVVDPAPDTVPTELAGYQVTNVNTFALSLPVPANATLASVALSGGAGLGGTPTATVAGDVVTIAFPGQIAGGGTFELPTITAHLTAGASGTVDTTLGGTSHADPGLTFNTVVVTPVGDVSTPTACFPNPNPVLTSTTIA